MCNRSEVTLIVNEILRTYRETYGEKLECVYLYGSYARGDYSESSDIDIAAIVKAERRQVQDDLKKVWDKSHDLELEYEVIVSPTAIPYEDFMTYRNILPYYRNIEQEGVLLDESA
jgi:predicted nucleotidyltransferase